MLENKKKKSGFKWLLILPVLSVFGLIIALNAPDTELPVTTNKTVTKVEPQKKPIAITQEVPEPVAANLSVTNNKIVRLENGQYMYRYTFSIKNNNKSKFKGKVIITLINQDDRGLYEKYTVDLSKGLSSGGTFDYSLGINTNPILEYGDGVGLKAFTYNVLVDDAVVVSGKGDIGNL